MFFKTVLGTERGWVGGRWSDPESRIAGRQPSSSQPIRLQKTKFGVHAARAGIIRISIFFNETTKTI